MGESYGYFPSFERRISQETYHGSLELANAGSNVLSEEADDLIRNGTLELIDFRLLAKDGDAEFEVGKFDVGNHSPLESGHQASLNTRNLGWRTIGRHDDLTSVFIEGVEGVEEFLLRGFLALEEVHVIDEEKIGLAKSAAELICSTSLNRVDVLVCELLGAQVGNTKIGSLGE